MTRPAWLGTDRRGADRVAGAGMRAHVRPGYRLGVVDFCERGALVEATRPLRPGAHVEVRFDAEEKRATVTARVLRCIVFAIHQEAGVIYRAALAFARPCAWTRETRTPDGYELHEDFTGRRRAPLDMRTGYPAGE